MDVVTHILNGLANAFAAVNLILMSVAMACGIVAGMLPGITVVTAIALAVPFTFVLPASTALLVLGAIFMGAVYGGSNAAILLNTPGQPSSVVTTLDGYPMTQKGQADDALYGALFASFIGGAIGVVILLLFFGPLAEISLKFGPAAFFWLAIFGLSTIAAMEPGNSLKGLLGGAIGLILSTVGLDPLTSSPRFTFGYQPLVQGLDMVALMIGLFSVSQMLFLLESNERFIATYRASAGALLRVSKALITRCKKLLLGCSLLGTFIGILPGAGGTVAAIIAYNEARRWDQDPTRFGTGVLEGVVAPECANNAAAAGALVPMMALGIPGSASAAVLMGGLLGQGLRPGTQLLQNNADVAYNFITGLFIVNFLLLIVGALIIRLSVRILIVPKSMIIPAVLALSVIGTYSLRNSGLDVVVMAVSGFAAYFLAKANIHPGTIALGVVLGPIAEQNLSIAIVIGEAKGSLLSVLVFDPIPATLIALSVLSLAVPTILSYYKKYRVTRLDNSKAAA